MDILRFFSGAGYFCAPALLGALLVGLFPDGTVAGILGVSPTRVDLATNGTPTVVRVRNKGTESVLVQVHAVQWSVDVDAAAMAGEVLAVPPVFDLGGQGEQVIRVALRRPLKEPVEQAYRLLITEVPREAGEPNALVFAVRLNLPVFVTPKGARADPVWSIRRGSGRAAELVLANNGGAHVRVQSLSLLGDGGAEPVLSVEQAAYVLAGEERSWPVFLPAGAVKELIVRAETNLGELEAQVALPGG